MSFETNVTNELLINTCGLHQLLPLESSALVTNVCPAVSTDFHCISTINKTHFDGINSGLVPVVIPGGTQHGIDNIRSKSGTMQVEVDAKNGVTSINISILLLFMAILFIWLN